MSGLPRPTRSEANARRSTSHSIAMAASQGSAISAVKCAKDKPVRRKARRLLRLETGINSDAEFARCTQA